MISLAACQYRKFGTTHSSPQSYRWNHCGPFDETIPGETSPRVQWPQRIWAWWPCFSPSTLGICRPSALVCPMSEMRLWILLAARLASPWAWAPFDIAIEVPSLLTYRKWIPAWVSETQSNNVPLWWCLSHPQQQYWAGGRWSRIPGESLSGSKRMARVELVVTDDPLYSRR